MKISAAVALRIGQLLNQKHMTQACLEKSIAMSHNTLKTLLRAENQAVNLKTIIQISRGFGMSVAEFFNDPIFEGQDLDID